MRILYNTFVLEIHKYSLWFLQQWLSILMTMSRKRPPKPWYISIKGRTNTNIKDNFFAKSKINIILFCYFVYQSVYKRTLKHPKPFNRTE